MKFMIASLYEMKNVQTKKSPGADFSVQGSFSLTMTCDAI